MRFSRWLVVNYLRSDGAIGNLARDVAKDPDCPKHRSGCKSWITYLKCMDADASCIAACEEAFDRYKAEQNERK